MKKAKAVQPAASRKENAEVVRRWLEKIFSRPFSIAESIRLCQETNSLQAGVWRKTTLLDGVIHLDVHQMLFLAFESPARDCKPVAAAIKAIGPGKGDRPLHLEAVRLIPVKKRRSPAIVHL